MLRTGLERRGDLHHAEMAWHGTDGGTTEARDEGHYQYVISSRGDTGRRHHQGQHFHRPSTHVGMHFNVYPIWAQKVSRRTTRDLPLLSL